MSWWHNAPNCTNVRGRETLFPRSPAMDISRIGRDLASGMGCILCRWGCGARPALLRGFSWRALWGWRVLCPWGAGPKKKKMELIWMVQTAPKPLLRCFKLSRRLSSSRGCCAEGQEFPWTSFCTQALCSLRKPQLGRAQGQDRLLEIKNDLPKMWCGWTLERWRPMSCIKRGWSQGQDSLWVSWFFISSKQVGIKGVIFLEAEDSVLCDSWACSCEWITCLQGFVWWWFSCSSSTIFFDWPYWISCPSWNSWWTCATWCFGACTWLSCPSWN